MNTKPIQISAEFSDLCEAAKREVNELSADAVEALLKTTPGSFYLIDVREKEEFSVARIAGATHLSKGWIEAKIHDVVSDKNKKVVLYCGGGHRSLLAALNLKKMGYTQVYSMLGGIKGWIKSGKTIEEV